MDDSIKIIVDLSKVEEKEAKGLLISLGFRVLNGSESVFTLKKNRLNADFKALSRLDWVVSVEKPKHFDRLKHLAKTFFLGDVEIGNDFAVIAGPCAVESREQVMSIAHEMSQQGLSLMRGASIKVRTSPYDFQGLGIEALDLLKETADRYNMTIVSEVTDIQHAMLAAPYVDCMQIGTRNMHNTSLLREVASIGKPVFLKRGFGSTVEEWMYAGEYLAVNGSRDVIFCERGIRTFETSTRFTLDLAGAVLLKQKTGLPVFIDPSHATGNPDLVIPLSLAAKAAGLDGIMVEVHEKPVMAMSDGAQALDFEGLNQLLNALDSLSVS